MLILVNLNLLFYFQLIFFIPLTLISPYQYQPFLAFNRIKSQNNKIILQVLIDIRLHIHFNLQMSQLNNSLSKQLYSFNKSERFERTHQSP
jgi:hypothetical protein